METKNGLVRRYRLQDANLPLGYNIVTGKLSFEVSKVLDPRGFAPTLVATDMSKLYVVDGKGIRPLTLREGLRLFGYPDEFSFDIPLTQGYDLLGNTVAVPVIEALSRQIIEALL
ncbi:MAG: DNA cytosine methyltransferase [Bacteroides sp.]